jgi:hypothetical protein
VAEEAGALGRRWLASHHPIYSADLAIAATTILNSSRLLTSNVRHFPMFRTYARRTDTANRPPCRGTVLAAPSGRWPLDVAASRPGSASALLDRANTLTNEPLTNEPLTNEPLTNEPLTNEPLTNEPQQEVPGAAVAGEPARLVAVRLDVLLAAVRAVEGNRPPGRGRHVGTVT